ncbi:hypothetical protein [Nonomuraea jabiensis]|uniref:hypothetical protein n=1 Tax=Nonomuraea jabiensis TaxID=882448 RepID=UPI003D75848A
MYEPVSAYLGETVVGGVVLPDDHLGEAAQVRVHVEADGGQAGDGHWGVVHSDEAQLLASAHEDVVARFGEPA